MNTSIHQPTATSGGLSNVIIVAALRARFPKIQGPKKDDIGYATPNRQGAVRALARQCQVVRVIGFENSSSSNRLREVVEGQGARAWMIDGPDDIWHEWFDGGSSWRGEGVTTAWMQEIEQRMEQLLGANCPVVFVL